MSDAEAGTETKPKGGGKKILVLSLVLGLAGAGGGYVAAASGLLPGGSAARPKIATASAPGRLFVPVDPIIVSLGATGTNRYLSFRAQLEVVPASASEVAALMPRVVDVLNGYLRAVDAREFDAPHGLIRLRAQMLRRVQLVVGDGKVTDLLVMEFVLN